MLLKKAGLLFVLFGIVLLSGCAGTFSTLMTAKPTEGAGIAFEGIVFVLGGTNVITSSDSSSPSFFPNPMFWYRGLPVKDFLEIGGKISLLSASADIKLIPLNLEMLSLAGDVEISYPFLYSGALTADIAASVLITFQPIQFISITAAPKFKYAMFSLPMFGGSAVVSLFNTKEFALLFDVSYITYLPGTFTSSSTSVFSDALTKVMNSTGFLSIGVGLQF